MSVPSWVPEKQIEIMILTFLRAKGIFCFKVDSVGYYDQRLKVYRKPNNPFRILGMPDIHGIYKGCPFYIEVKKAKGRLSPEQKIFLDRAKKEGAIAFVAHSVEEVKSYLGIA